MASFKWGERRFIPVDGRIIALKVEFRLSTVELVVATVEFLAPAASFKRRFISVDGRIISLKVEFRLPTVELIVVTVEFPLRMYKILAKKGLSQIGIGPRSLFIL